MTPRRRICKPNDLSSATADSELVAKTTSERPIQHFRARFDHAGVAALSSVVYLFADALRHFGAALMGVRRRMLTELRISKLETNSRVPCLRSRKHAFRNRERREPREKGWLTTGNTEATEETINNQLSLINGGAYRCGLRPPNRQSNCPPKVPNPFSSPLHVFLLPRRYAMVSLFLR